MKTVTRYLLSLLLVLMPASSFPTPQGQKSVRRTNNNPPQVETAEEPDISENAKRQIGALLEQKKNRTAEQRKMDPNLLLEIKQATEKKDTERNPAISTNTQLDDRRRALVDIRGNVSNELLQKIEQLGGEVVFSSAPDQSIRARVPLPALEELARSSDVNFIEAAVEAATHRETNAPLALSSVSPPPPSEQPNFASRAAQLKEKLSAVLAARNTKKPVTADDSGTNAIVTGPPFSQGVRAHRADDVQNIFGFDGTGVRIGVLSDSVFGLAQSQASKNLPPDVTVLPGQAGSTTGGGEGTAMLEIVNDMAPGAKLFFATAFISDASFADNIRKLRFDYKCDIIVDDIFYFNEHPFQDAIIARAVNDVTADGAMYFSSAGNEGNINDGTGGVWEGDFLDGGTVTTLPFTDEYRVHSFGDRLISNRIRARSTSGYSLFWSDPWGKSNNDYDLFILDSTLSFLKGASLRDQTGTQDPYEFISSTNITTGDRVVIAKLNNAQPRALHLNTIRGQLAIATIGQTKGHSGAANAISVAAVNAAVANGGAFSGGYTNPVETFSSDGPRRIFFNPDGSPIVPGNFLFTTNGGTVRQKPDIAAADGVSTSVPGFTSFFGTSAAAPHAAAIAALIKSFAPNLTGKQVRDLMVSTALDIGPYGWDRTAGQGIVTPLGSYLAFSPSPLLQYFGAETFPVDGDRDKFIEPGETAQLNVIFFNEGNAPANNLKAKVTSSTPGITMVAGESDYASIADGKAGVNLSPFRYKLASNVPCGTPVNFTVSFSANNLPVRTTNFSVQTGQPGTVAKTTPYTGVPVAIPDGVTTGVAIRVPVSGLTNTISRVSFRIDGTNCSTAAGVGLQHAWVGDLTLRLTSPTGTTVTLMSAPGGVNNFGQNFCNTLFDDAGTASIQNILPTGAPYTGTYRPASPLAAFNGENPNGNWTLQAIDSTRPDAGILRAFSILVYTYDCQQNAVTIDNNNTSVRQSSRASASARTVNPR